MIKTKRKQIRPRQTRKKGGHKVYQLKDIIYVKPAIEFFHSYNEPPFNTNSGRMPMQINGEFIQYFAQINGKWYASVHFMNKSYHFPLWLFKKITRKAFYYELPNFNMKKNIISNESLKDAIPIFNGTVYDRLVAFDVKISMQNGIAGSYVDKGKTISNAF